MDDGIRYAPTDDGSHVAYRVRGQGPIDVLEFGGYGTLLPLDAADDQPRWRRFEERLGRFCRLIRFDHRGVGYSDTIAAPTLDTWVADGLAVLDAVGSDRATLLATAHNVQGAISLAAAHPDRVSSLVLANGGPRATWAPDYPVGLKLDDAEQRVAIADREHVHSARAHQMARRLRPERSAV